MSDKMVDLRVAHLNMIQAVISRMSGYSAGVKNFCVTINAGVIAVAYQKQVPLLIWAGAAFIAIFCIMDSYYLALERRYRRLYEDVAARPLEQAEDMSLKADSLKFSSYLSAFLSNSVVGFYALLLIGVSALLYIASDDQSAPIENVVVRNSGMAEPGANAARATPGIATAAGAYEGADAKQSTPAEPTGPAHITNAIGPSKPIRGR